MRIYSSSRRQDILVGSLVSTVVVFLLVLVSSGPGLVAQPVPPRLKEPPLKPFEIPRDDDLIQAGDPVRTESTPAPQPPEIQDTPRPANTDSFIQPIEPPRPDSDMTAMGRIPPGWDFDPGPVTEVFDPSKLDQQPVARFQASPTYPYELKRQGITGEVIVDFIVDTNGNVRNATALPGSNADFSASAAAAVSKWKFRPGRKANHAVFTHMQVPIEFRLQDASP